MNAVHPALVHAQLLPVRAGGGPGQGEVGDHRVGERDVAVLADDLQHPGAVALRPRPDRAVADRLLAAAPGGVGVDLRSPRVGSGPSTSAGTGPATARPRRRPWPAPAPAPRGRRRRRAARSPRTGPRRGAGRSGPPPARPACPAAPTTSRVASSTSRSAAGLAIPRVTMQLVDDRGVGQLLLRRDPPPPLHPGQLGTGRRGAVLGQPRPPAAAAAPAPRRSAAPSRAAAPPGAAPRGAGCRRLGHDAWTWQKPTGHHRQSCRQNRPRIPFIHKGFGSFVQSEIYAPDSAGRRRVHEDAERVPRGSA